MLALGRAACLTENEVAEIVNGIARGRACAADASKFPKLDKQFRVLEGEIADLRKKLGAATCEDDRVPLKVRLQALLDDRQRLVGAWGTADMAVKCIAALAAQGLAD